MVVVKKIENGELYLYMNGELIYKKWLESGESKVFDVMAYDKYTLASIHELDYECVDALISVRARLKLKTTEDGGRKKGIISGYRPNHVFEYGPPGKPLPTYVGDIHFNDRSTIEPGEEAEVVVRFLPDQPIERFLRKGCTWRIHEGAAVIGEAEMI